MVEQGARQLYYERYQSAENTFNQDPGNSTAWYYLEKDYLLENELDKSKSKHPIDKGSK